MKNGYKMYKLIVILVSILTIIISTVSEKGAGYEYIEVIPFVYLLFFVICKRFHKYSQQFNGLLILNGLMFLKYCLTILAICATNSYTLPSYYAMSVSISSYHMATLIMVGEEVLMFLIVELFSSSIYGVSCNQNKQCQKGYKPIKIGPVLFSFIFLSVILIFIYPKHFFGSISILFSSENQLTETIESSHILSAIFGAFRIIIIGLLINSNIVKYQKRKSIKYILICYILIIIHCVLNVSTSRMNIIIPFFLFALITSNLFNKAAMYLNIGIFMILAIIIGIVSVYKMPWIFVNGSPFLAFFSDFAKRLQEYTSNVMPTAMGLQAIEVYGSEINFFTLFKDFFGAMPIVSHFFNENEMIYTIYNKYALGGLNNTQLIPMTISSIAYFTPLGTYILVCLCVLILMIFENRNRIVEQNYLNDYLKLYLFFIFASCTFSNVQMISGRLFANYVPAILVLYINQKIGHKICIKIGRKKIIGEN